MKVAKFIVCLASVCALMSAPAFAQEDNNRDENGKIVRGPYLTNGFWSNWFVSAGGGIDLVIDGVKGGNPNTGGITPTFDVNFGKWFTPEFGARLGYQGIAYKNNDEKLPNHLVHGDLMWNIVNQFWGYKETRVYNAIPYMTAGFFASSRKTGTGLDLMTGVGLLNNFRITNNWMINVDPRLCFTHGEQFKGAGEAALFSVTAGVTYNFGKANWKRYVDNTDELNALKDANEALENANKALANDKNALANDNDKLNDTNKALQDEIDALKKAAEDAANAADNTCVLYFGIGQDQLTTLESQHLRYFVENVDKNKTFTVTGSADASTGSAKRNDQLCTNRVDTVVAKLRAAGISDDQIIIGENQIVDIESPEMGRTVVIVY